MTDRARQNKNAWQRRYEKTLRGRAVKKKYQHSEKGKATSYRWNHSEGYTRARKKYRGTEQYREWNRFQMRSKRVAKKIKENRI